MTNTGAQSILTQLPQKLIHSTKVLYDLNVEVTVNRVVASDAL